MFSVITIFCFFFDPLDPCGMITDGHRAEGWMMFVNAEDLPSGKLNIQKTMENHHVYPLVN